MSFATAKGSAAAATNGRIGDLPKEGHPMTERVSTSAAEAALARLISQYAEAAAGTNDLVSRREARSLHPFVRRADDELRADKTQFSRVRVDELAERAKTQALEVWRTFNPPDRLGQSFTKDELEQVVKADPDLGGLSRAAFFAAGARTTAERTGLVRRFLEDNPGAGVLFERRMRFGERIDARVGEQGRRRLPPAVLESFDALFMAERADWGSVTAKAVRLAGFDLFAVHLGTDGDEGLLELYDQSGAPMLSARLWAGQVDRIDEYFGLGRHAGSLSSLLARPAEGLEDPLEREAAGQIPLDWRADAIVNTGTLYHGPKGVTKIDLQPPLTDEQALLARFALEVMYDRSLRYRAEGPGPISFEDNASLALGEHVDPRDGQRYLVADYRDIDNDSRTLYFQRTCAGGLRLAVDQANG